MCMRLGIVSTLVCLDKTVCILHLAYDSSLPLVELSICSMLGVLFFCFLSCFYVYWSLLNDLH